MPAFTRVALSRNAFVPGVQDIMEDGRKVAVSLGCWKFLARKLLLVAAHQTDYDVAVQATFCFDVTNQTVMASALKLASAWGNQRVATTRTPWYTQLRDIWTETFAPHMHDLRLRYGEELALYFHEMQVFGNQAAVLNRLYHNGDILQETAAQMVIAS